MTTEPKPDPRTTFVPRYLPWILTGVMLAVYWFTLEHWVSLYNVDYVARVSGWMWQPETYAPLTYLVTLPLHWLPGAQIPIALNLLSAVFGALTLGLLARSVALLPQDRTEPQRVRETSDFSFLTTGTAWLPPMFAVLACGLQFTFWLHATNFTGETLDLLVFAFTVWTLLEYRLDEREGRLMLAMFIYGADLTQNVALIGYLPLLLGALIWICGMGFFNSRFLTRLIFCGLAGVSLYLLLPTLGLVSGKLPENLWWLSLKVNLIQQWHAVRFFFTSSGFRHDLGLISLTSLLPLVMLSFRWGASFGDRSRLGSELTGLMLHLVYGILLLVCVWGTFDPPFSGRHLTANNPGLTCLTFYYLAALCIGYLSGYFLLVSKPLAIKSSRRRPSPLKKFANPAVILFIFALAALATTGLVCKNGPIIQANNSGPLKKYARLLAAGLPPTGGIVLSDSETAQSDDPRRLYFLEAALVEAGREKEYVPVDTYSLNLPGYHRFLHQKYPDKWPLLVDARAKDPLDPHGLLALVSLLAKTNDIYYLHPSFGYYFELFYLEAHGLIYRLKALPEDTLLPRLPDARLAGENEAFWAQAAEAFDPVITAVAPVNPFAHPHGLKQKLMAHLHVQPEPNFNAQVAGMYYSRDLDFWGVQVQRAARGSNDLSRAAAHFETAQRLNPDNVVAGYNLAFNQDLQAGKSAQVDASRSPSEQFGKYRTWNEMIMDDGPFDEPSFCYAVGESYFQTGFLIQAVGAFSRVHQLVPDYLPAILSLGELYVFAHRADRALAVMKEPLAHPEKFSLMETNSTELNVIAAAAYIQNKDLPRGTSLLEKEIAWHPDNASLLASATQVYLSQNLFTNALHAINLRLQLTPNDPAWLYSLGYTQMRLNRYDQAIATLTRVLSIKPDNNNALFNRALAFLNTGKLNAARSDYQQLQKIKPDSYQVAYGLGEIAWRQHETNEAAQNYTVYLANAPTNSAESKMVRKRLDSLQGKAP